jgi:PAT family beta-lactamase induction signal transducer AmpG
MALREVQTERADAPPKPPLNAAAVRRLAAATLLGFSSGLPLALSGAALQAWLTVAGHDVSTIGFLTLIGLPYTFKFLWAPLMDRFEPPLLGRRRGWMLVTQLGLVAALFALSYIPAAAVGWIGLVAAIVAFLSASQDIVIDAWRTDAMAVGERGLAASLGVLGYRLAMVLSGGVALIWADPTQGGMSWPDVYRRLALVLLGAAGVALALVPGVAAREPETNAPPARQEFAGFAAVLLAAAAGWAIAKWPGTWLGGLVVAPLGLSEKLQTGWTDLVALGVGMAVALPLGANLARRFGYDSLLRSLEGFLSLPRARLLLVAVVAYKLGDAFAFSLNTTFLLKGAGFTSAEVGVVNKVFGIWLTVLGSLVGGALLPILGLSRSLVLFGLCQAAAVFGFYLLAVHGQGAWGASQMPAFDLGVVWLKEAVSVDHGLLGAVAAENLTSGMGTAAFVALLMALARSRFSATQYALLSALAAVGRVWVGPFAGVLSDAAGWPAFFLVAIATGLPGVWLVWTLRGDIDAMAVREG